MRRPCSFAGCQKVALTGGACKTHGGGKRCSEAGCDTLVVGQSGKCIKHGGGKRCTFEGCTRSAQGRTTLCMAHGGGNRCDEEGCQKLAQGGTGKCIGHGGGPRCRQIGCTKSAVGGKGLCVTHGGGKRCKFLVKQPRRDVMTIGGADTPAEAAASDPEAAGPSKPGVDTVEESCNKLAVCGYDYCVAHGGGKRCSEEGCDKLAKGASGKCKRHGGGPRCVYVGDEGPCDRSARDQTTKLCSMHGGGPRCKQPGCEKAAHGGGLCKAHGGGKRCMMAGGCKRSAQPGTDYCRRHFVEMQQRRPSTALLTGSTGSGDEAVSELPPTGVAAPQKELPAFAAPDSGQVWLAATCVPLPLTVLPASIPVDPPGETGMIPVVAARADPALMLGLQPPCGEVEEELAGPTKRQKCSLGGGGEAGMGAAG